MKVYLGTDHAGFELKEKIRIYLSGLGFNLEDMGALSLDSGDDYPDYIHPVALAVAKSTEDFGIVLGKSGQGEAMCANRTPGVRAAVFYGGDLEMIRLEREHNNANILSIGAAFVAEEEAKNAVKKFLETKFSGEERHLRRISKF